MATPVGVFAQVSGATVKVTQTLHSDGTQTVLRSDLNEHQAEATLLDVSKKVLQRTVYTLDDQGQYLAAAIYNGNNKLLMKSTYKRDSSNRVFEQLDFTADDQLLRRLAFEYDSRGKLMRVRTFDPAGNDITPASSNSSKSRSR